jgi:NTE family protein
MSGGGYRAMAYHLGTLLRLNEAGWLPRLDVVSSVSGGSITAGRLAAAWKDLRFDEAGVAQNFWHEMVEPIRRMASKTIDIRAALQGAVRVGRAGRSIARAYDRVLTDGALLSDLPARPRFSINATNLQSGVLWEFSRERMGDYRIGYVQRPATPLADAVAASSGFPPVLAPLMLDTRGMRYVKGPFSDLHAAKDAAYYHAKVPLADGGIYDNLGLEPAIDFAVMLVSNGSGPAREQRPPRTFGQRVGAGLRLRWLGVFSRTFGLINAQVRSLRKRMLFDEEKEPGGPRVAYWHVWIDYNKFDRGQNKNKRLPVDPDEARRLAATPTRLKRMDDATFEGLVNWGYASCDVVMRAFIERDLAKPVGFPFKRGVQGEG